MNLTPAPHLFPVGHRFEGEEVDLVVRATRPGNKERGRVPSYEMDVVLSGTFTIVGDVNVRIGYTDHLVFYGGQLGYSIERPFRGRRYASKACALTRPIFAAHGMDTVWVTCRPKNVASSRTCELLGCQYIETVTVPKGTDLFKRGDRQLMRFRWLIVE